MRISDWSSDVCSSDLLDRLATEQVGQVARLDDLLFIVPQIALSHEAMAEIIDPTATKSPKMVIAAQFRTKFGQLAQVPFSYQIGSIARAAEERRQCGMRGRKSDIDRKSTRLNSSH